MQKYKKTERKNSETNRKLNNKVFEMKRISNYFYERMHGNFGYGVKNEEVI